MSYRRTKFRAIYDDDPKRALELFKAHIEKANGEVDAIAEALDVTRKTVYTYLAQHPELKRHREKVFKKLADAAAAELGE